ncbi:MAG: SMP-30/gluconolactonase/LRE family protein [Actinomycetes bacterium]
MSNDTMTPTPEPIAPAPGEAESTGMSRRTLIILISAVCVLLLLLLGAFAWWAKTGKPLSQIPVLSQETPPHFSTAVYDVTKPLGVAIDEANNRMYVTQSDGPRTVAVFDLDGNSLGQLEPGGKKSTIHLPIYAAVDPSNGDVYVTDRGASAVYVYDSSGNYVKEFKPKGVNGWSPLGIAFSPDGSLFVSDLRDPQQVIWQLKTDGTVVRKIGEVDKLSFVNGLAVTADGRLLATDSNAGRVLVYQDGNKAVGAIARGDADAPMGLPRGAAVDDRGRLYVVDTVNQAVRVYLPAEDPTNPIPVYSFSFGAEGTIDGGFEFPNGVATDSKGKVYVTDRENNRVQVWSY